MPSQIDPTKPLDGVLASKAELRANLLAAKNEIEALQAGGTFVEDTQGTSFTLAAADNGKRLVATAGITITLPALATLGNGFECVVVNDSGSDVTIAGATSVVLDAHDVASIMEANGKQRVIKGLSVVVRS